MPESIILLIDDEQSVRYSITRALSSTDLEVQSYETAKQGINAIKQQPPDAVLLDIRLPDMSGLDALEAIREIDQRIPVVVITAHGTTETAIEATKRGAFDYLLKPFELTYLRDVVDRALHTSRLARRPLSLGVPGVDDGSLDAIVGRSSVIHEVFKAVGRVAASDVSVLLLGESGSGKELVARAIYQHSKRSDRPFLAINCAAIPETLLESELFGHEKGAFTGADRQRIGRFEQASGGTIFLDEIGDMNAALQAKILRVLQDQRFERVGGRETIQTDVRVIAATNQNLVELVNAGRFRQDLFYRLNTYTIVLPPLRVRGVDLELLVDHFISLHGREIGKSVASAAPETLQILRNYPWPGNVRELQGVIKSAIINSTTAVLTPDCLPHSLTQASSVVMASAALQPHFDLIAFVESQLSERDGHLYRRAQFAFDRVVIGEVLRAVDGNQVEAARILGISRTTLRAKLSGIAGAAADAGNTEPERVDP